MLDAKLFAGLASVAFVIAILGRFRVIPRPNLWISVASVSFGTFYWQLFIALVCAVLGLAYLGAVRLTLRTPHETLGHLGFLVVAFAFVVLLASSYLTTSDPPLFRWLLILRFVGIFGFILGVTVSAANVAWALLRKI